MVANMEQQWGRKSWGVWEQLQFLVMLGQWVLNVMLRVLVVFLPHHISTSPIIKALESLSQSDIFYTQDEMREYQSWSGNTGGSEQGAIGRALAQVLVLMNDMPASFRKYGFVRAMAERILSDNDLQGGVTLKQINQLTLETGFARTVYMLSNFLDNQQRKQQVQALSWPWRALKGLPLGTSSLSLPFLPLLACLKKGADLISQIVLPQNQTPSESLSVLDTYQDGEMAEKLAQELLWLAEKLNEFSTMEGAVLQWSSASFLANLSLYASPRVQRSLVKLSGFLCNGLASGAIETSPEVTLKLLILWLPLLCTATHGVDGTIFSSSERAEAERMLEQVIMKLLPEAEQELVLAVWLREFIASSSDWPNLQLCYHNWCHKTRKLSYFASSICDDRPLKQLCLQ
ncbi:hypothetical protein O6H91_07G024800 [Diphasiastrum complanatum]|uniref:Uncharacterized protein n=1 Tax=Diphasiastrum complanatum TaxID=34168 RepID=A0ACC2D374_DIPCM|nr:hypothetical protein O6H91_07G024800 [Diphasiastrum complanatum]